MSLASVEAACKGDGQLANETMVGYTEVSQFARKADEMSDEIRGVYPAVDKHSSVDVGVARWRVDGRLWFGERSIWQVWNWRDPYLNRNQLIIDTPHEGDPDAISQYPLEG